MFRTDFITHEPEELYHSQSKSGKYMSSHLLADFRKSPALYRRKILGQITEAPSTAFAIGTAVHKAVLEGKAAFETKYIVSDGPINPRTGEPFGRTSKAYKDWLGTQNKEVISGEDFGTVARCYQSVSDHPIAKDMLLGGVAEGVVRTTLHDVPCQIRMDYFHPEFGLIDYKTAAELQWFETDAKRYGYILQMAFYHDVIQAETDYDVPVHIIATEKCEPMSTGVWVIPPETLQMASRVIAADLRRYRAALESDEWVTKYETERILDNF